MEGIAGGGTGGGGTTTGLGGLGGLTKHILVFFVSLLSEIEVANVRHYFLNTDVGIQPRHGCFKATHFRWEGGEEIVNQPGINHGRLDITGAVLH